MSAFGGKADISRHYRDVRFWGHAPGNLIEPIIGHFQRSGLTRYDAIPRVNT
jgi:hypothetical protein